MPATARQHLIRRRLATCAAPRGPSRSTPLGAAHGSPSHPLCGVPVFCVTCATLVPACRRHHHHLDRPRDRHRHCAVLPGAPPPLALPGTCLQCLAVPGASLREGRRRVRSAGSGAAAGAVARREPRQRRVLDTGNEQAAGAESASGAISEVDGVRWHTCSEGRRRRRHSATGAAPRRCVHRVVTTALLPRAAGGARLQLHMGAGAARAGEQQPAGRRRRRHGGCAGAAAGAAGCIEGQALAATAVLAAAAAATRHAVGTVCSPQPCSSAHAPLHQTLHTGRGGLEGAAPTRVIMMWRGRADPRGATTVSGHTAAGQALPPLPLLLLLLLLLLLGRQ